MCEKIVMRNSIQCIKVQRLCLQKIFWYHKRLKSVINYECDRCKDVINDKKYLKLECNEIEIV